MTSGRSRFRPSSSVARQKLAAAQRADLGRPPLGTRLTGYTPKGEVIQDEAEIVRVVFDRFTGGDSLRAIAAWLGETGVKTRRGGAWSPSTVATILKNPRYAGRAVYNGKPTGKPGDWEPIVTPEVFDRAQRRLDDPRRKTHHEGYDRRHLGAGLYRCGRCGKAMHSHTGARYRCPAGCLIRSAVPIDELVCGVVAARLARPDLAELLPTVDVEEVRAITGEIDRLTARIEEIEQDYDEGNIDGRRYRTATEKVQAELTAARSRLVRLTGSVGAAGDVLRADDPAEAFAAAPLMIRRSVIDLLLEVRVLTSPRGRRGFDPETVALTWKVA
ncbi:recombinase family protein [Pseudonocardia charpentierae]|uniref:Recombinase family protein n=1 Tax=Pseudonocardia charpentierae TaxID=3075545 RepID=A0ABU2NL32_9PSEU|nr:recombinase family protein [Pseudonocardia sp. DSM 45834]MDT0353723.1 recombinase family protein [Pseudonocardia sp. DSM 45834]